MELDLRVILELVYDFIQTSHIYQISSLFIQFWLEYYLIDDFDKWLEFCKRALHWGRVFWQVIYYFDYVGWLKGNHAFSQVAQTMQKVTIVFIYYVEVNSKYY